MLLTSTFVPAQKPVLRKVFDTAWDKEGDQYTKYCHVKTSEDAYETDYQFQSPDEIAEADEGGMYTRVEVEAVRSKVYTHILYKGEMKASRESVEDIKYSTLYNCAGMLGKAAKRTVERKCANVLIGGLSGSQTSPDGSAIFATHTLANPLSGRPTTFSNTSTNRLTAANLKNRISQGAKTLDEHGSLAPYKLKRLIVPFYLSWTAKQLAQSELEPGTANNDKNVVKEGLEVVVVDWLAEAAANADTAWFLQDPTNHMLNFFWRVKPEHEMVHDPSTGDFIYRVRMRFSVGVSDYRGLDGNSGTV